ncbi:MAG: phosphatidylglycerophosphatase A [Planctomycetales bacterium]|nr:phosphatidylglycerophosphatase A [Planctomycetales bacterium]
MKSHDNNPLPATALPGRLALWVATGLGVGMVAPAPGTIGGLWGVPLAAMISHVSPVSAQIGIAAVLFVLAALIATAAERALGGGHDPQSIVIDEIVALPIVFIGVGPANWVMLLVGFLLFRLCDITKPGLARTAEKLPGGWGVVADDVLAAVLACILLHAAIGIDRWLEWGWLSA